MKIPEGFLWTLQGCLSLLVIALLIERWLSLFFLAVFLCVVPVFLYLIVFLESTKGTFQEELYGFAIGSVWGCAFYWLLNDQFFYVIFYCCPIIVSHGIWYLASGE